MCFVAEDDELVPVANVLTCGNSQQIVIQTAVRNIVNYGYM